MAFRISNATFYQGDLQYLALDNFLGFGFGGRFGDCCNNLGLFDGGSAWLFNGLWLFDSSWCVFTSATSGFAATATFALATGALAAGALVAAVLVEIALGLATTVVAFTAVFLTAGFSVRGRL